MSTNANIVRMMCPNLKCRALLCVPQHARGKTVRCKNCGSCIKVPAPKAGVTQQVPGAPEQGEAA